MEKLIALLALAFTWAHLVGEWVHERNPIILKKHGYKAKKSFDQDLPAFFGFASVTNLNPGEGQETPVRIAFSHVGVPDGARVSALLNTAQRLGYGGEGSKQARFDDAWWTVKLRKAVLTGTNSIVGPGIPLLIAFLTRPDSPVDDDRLSN